MVEYKLVNTERTKVLDSFINGGRKLKAIGGKKASWFEPAFLAAHGWLPIVQPDPSINRTVYAIGDEVIGETEITYATTLRPEADIRADIKAAIYARCKMLNDQPAQLYSITEACRWTEDREHYKAGNWAHFDSRSGAMTGEQYALSRVEPKIKKGDDFVNQNIAKRTDLLVALDATPYEELVNFDYTSMWDDASDYVAPDPGEVPLTAWQQFLGAIQWWK